MTRTKIQKKGAALADFEHPITYAGYDQATLDSLIDIHEALAGETDEAIEEACFAFLAEQHKQRRRKFH